MQESSNNGKNIPRDPAGYGSPGDLRVVDTVTADPDIKKVLNKYNLGKNLPDLGTQLTSKSVTLKHVGLPGSVASFQPLSNQQIDALVEAREMVNSGVSLLNKSKNTKLLGTTIQIRNSGTKKSNQASGSKSESVLGDATTVSLDWDEKKVIQKAEKHAADLNSL